MNKTEKHYEIDERIQTIRYYIRQHNIGIQLEEHNRLADRIFTKDYCLLRLDLYTKIKPKDLRIVLRYFYNKEAIDLKKAKNKDLSWNYQYLATIKHRL